MWACDHRVENALGEVGVIWLRTLFALFGVVILVGSAWAKRDDFIVTGVPVPGALNVRSEPAATGRKLAALKNGDAVWSEECVTTPSSDGSSDTTWCKVHVDARSGWARKKYFQLDDDGQTYFTFGFSDSSGVSGRSAPGLDERELFLLPLGARGNRLGECLEAKGEIWCKIDVPVVVGWANARYLLLQSSKETVPEPPAASTDTEAKESSNVDWSVLPGEWASSGQCSSYVERFTTDGRWQTYISNKSGQLEIQNDGRYSIKRVESQVCVIEGGDNGGCAHVKILNQTQLVGTWLNWGSDDEFKPEAFSYERCSQLPSSDNNDNAGSHQSDGLDSKSLVPSPSSENDSGREQAKDDDEDRNSTDPPNQDSKLLKLPVLGWWPFIVGLVVSTLVALRKGTGNFSRAVAVFFAVGISIILAYFLVPDFGRSADLHGGLRTLLAYCGAGALAFYALLTMLDGSGPADPSTLAGRELLPLDAVDPAYFIQHLAAKHVVSQRVAARNTTVQSVRRDYYPFRQAGGTLEVEYFGEIQVRLQYLPKGVIPRRVNSDMAHVYVEGSLSVTYVTWVCTLKRQAEEKPERGARVAPRFYLRGELGTEPHFLPEMGKEAFKAVFKAQMDNAIQSEIRKKVLPPYASPDLSYIRVRIGEWIEVRDEEEIYAPFHRIDYKFRGRRRVSFACADGKNLVTGVQTTSEARKSVAKIVLTANRESGLF